MSSKEEGVLQLDYVASKLRIVHDHCLQYLDLHLSLLVKFVLVANDLQSHHFFFLMVESLENLSEGSMP